MHHSCIILNIIKFDLKLSFTILFKVAIPFWTIGSLGGFIRGWG